MAIMGWKRSGKVKQVVAQIFSIFLREGLQTIIYALELTSSKDDRNFVPRLLFKDMY